MIAFLGKELDHVLNLKKLSFFFKIHQRSVPNGSLGIDNLVNQLINCKMMNFILMSHSSD